MKSVQQQGCPALACLTPPLKIARCPEAFSLRICIQDSFKPAFLYRYSICFFMGYTGLMIPNKDKMCVMSRFNFVFKVTNRGFL